jgi:hypothetical protein
MGRAGNTRYRYSVVSYISKIEERGIIEAFVSRWVLRDRRERALFELTREDKRNKFIDRLNHQWATRLDMRHLVKVGKAEDTVEGIEQIMRINPNYTYYIISNYRELDGRVVQLSEALTSIYGNKMGWLHA